MKRICHMTSAHGRYDVRIFEKECTSLANNGYEVYLVVNDNDKDEIKNNVHIISTRFQPKNRLHRMLTLTKLVYKKALLLDADLYHFHDPELLLYGMILKLRGKQVIFDSHENVSEQIMDKAWIAKPVRKIVSVSYQIIERYITKRLDSVISVSPQFVEQFQRINKNAALITNYPIISVKKVNYNRGSKNICFAGGISKQWYHDNVIKAITNLNDVCYFLAGNADSSYLNHLKSLPGWNKVVFLGQVPHEEVQNIYSKAFAGIAVNYSNQIKGKGTLGNTKLFEFMEAGLPVICTDYTLWKDIIDQHKCGICVNPLDPLEIEKALRYLFENPEIAEEMGKNGHDAIKKYYNWSIEEHKLLKLYKELI